MKNILTFFYLYGEVKCLQCLAGDQTELGGGQGVVHEETLPEHGLGVQVGVEQLQGPGARPWHTQRAARPII